jgi:hypothetical protein
MKPGVPALPKVDGVLLSRGGQELSPMTALPARDLVRRHDVPSPGRANKLSARTHAALR